MTRTASDDTTDRGTVYADVILPLSLARTYTYAVPEEFVGQLREGQRVEVQFSKNKHYAGIIRRMHGKQPNFKTKPILSVIDLEPLLTIRQLELWDWMAEYYCCTLGEVMTAGLPSHLKMASETIITLGPMFSDDVTQLDEDEYLVVEALTLQSELSLKNIRDILQRKTVYPVIRSLLDRHVIFPKEEMTDRYKALEVKCVRFSPQCRTEAERIAAFDKVSRSEKQTAVLLEFMQYSRTQPYVRRTDLSKRTGASDAVIKAMVKKEIFEFYDREISRIGGEEATAEAGELSAQQREALGGVRRCHELGKPALIHGVTSSGKTRVYLELMQEAIAADQQVLYLLPEIALTGQIIKRLQRVLGDRIMVYHSRLNNMERVEIWKAVLSGKTSVVGPRSALFLPFTNLGLVVVDEEHDPSFKQHDPSPRYNGRDVAMYLAHQHGARAILGSATPSLESWENAAAGKYGLVRMTERFGGIAPPEVVIADSRETDEKGMHHPFFTPTLLAEMRRTIERGEQVILFQNRRGFAPVYFCPTCEYTVQCVNCDVSLTYHKYQHRLRCHCCGYVTAPPESCPACGELQLKLSGTGTEKIEDELKIFLPDARIARMDLDTTRGKHALGKLIEKFEVGELDILVGTQMVTKGLDFERVGLVGVISADQLLRFPDFRADERAFQLMLQVAGRAGRRDRRGKVVIQAHEGNHPVLTDVLAADYDNFIQREAGHRSGLHFPPYRKMIRIQLRHTRRNTVEEAAKLMGTWLAHSLGDRLEGPFEPSVARLRTYYLQDMVVRFPPSAGEMRRVKDLLRRATDKLGQTQGLTGVRVVIDVDPY
ncbi:primosomal protein N' (replication factor Y) [Lewinella aquimaris]|uniref:Replication restart protein PriA n=1 Tax=Neolewinella aquimaris TaxID=1835722 RepID=A0A840EB10_9BACT|nr:primosomal protein N' [Neolewinella aquimaris]MBB4080627.1 primosomal protein N' (replication factor Y) [Neolewinella aquimaris]